MSPPHPVIEVHDVSKRYRIGEIGGAPEMRRLAARVLRRPRLRGPEPSTFWALKDVRLTVAEGEVLGIIGRNGAGKSTLLKILARITEPTIGMTRTRGRVGALLEVGTGFHPELTGRENVYLNGAVLGMARSEVSRRFDSIVEFAGVERFIDTPLKRYSSGMELRLAFAVAAHLEPDILVVDEVLAVGDTEFQRRCLGRMSELTRLGRTVLFVTHDHGAMARLVSRIVWLDGGKVVADGPTTEVLTAYAAATSPPASGDRRALPRAGPVTVQAAVAYRPDGSHRLTPRRGDPVRVCVGFSLERSVPMLDVGFYVKTDQGVWVVNEAWSDELPPMLPTGRPGEYTVTLELPPVLASGDYVVALWMGSPYETLIDEDVLALTVEPRHDDRAEAVARPRLVHPSVSWQVEDAGVD